MIKWDTSVGTALNLHVHESINLVKTSGEPPDRNNINISTNISINSSNNRISSNSRLGSTLRSAKEELPWDSTFILKKIEK